MYCIVLYCCPLGLFHGRACRFACARVGASMRTPASSAGPLLSSVCRRCGPSSGRHFHFGDGQVSVCHWVDGGVCLHVLILLIGFCVTCEAGREGVGGPRARARGSDTVYLLSPTPRCSTCAGRDYVRTAPTWRRRLTDPRS